MNTYKVLNKQTFSNGEYSILPIRMQDRYLIMQWRNEQIYHLRQNKPLTEYEQARYFNTVVAGLFEQEKPSQILFSYLKGNKCIGYGGLVHINWEDKNAEISFIMDTSLEKDYFDLHWKTFLGLIEEVAFREMGLHKIFTYAFDLRPKLYAVLEEASFVREAVLKQHCYFENRYIDVIIHSKILDQLYLRNALLSDINLTYQWATDSKVRMYSFAKEKIEWENHKNWYSDKITDINCEYYILNYHGNNIGSIRFDIDRDGIAMISYLIDPGWHGKGLGKLILEYGIERLRSRRDDVKLVFGIVLPENVASIRIFEKLGFLITLKNKSNYRFEKEI